MLQYVSIHLNLIIILIAISLEELGSDLKQMQGPAAIVENHFISDEIP